MASQRIQLLEEQYRKEPSPERKIDLLTEIGVEKRNYDLVESMKCADLIIKEAQHIGYRLGLGRGKNLKGSVHTLQGEYEEGMKWLTKANEIATDIKEDSLKARVQINIGNLYRDQGDFANALTYYERALKLNENASDPGVLAANLNNIANLWYELGDYETALEYALKCVPILESEKSRNRLVNTYITLGNIYFKKEVFTEARQYFEQIMALAEANTSAYLLAWSGVGKVCYRLNDFDTAIAILKEALIEADKMEVVEVQIICRYYLGHIYLKDESFRKAKLYLEEAYKMASDYSRRHDMMTIHEALSMVYDEMGNVPKAFEHLKNYERLKEEIFAQATFNKLRNLQIQQQTELANKEREVAERTARLKQQFMANMSHEIRTPMNAIVGMTRLLLDKDPLESQKKYLNAIAQSADNLLVIINDILDLSKIEAGKIIIEHVPFKLRSVLNSMKDMLWLKADEKGLYFKVHVAEDIPDKMIGDPTRINQVLINLVGNAIKFTEQGGIDVHVKLQDKEDHVYHILFEVADTGIGISEEYVKKIFDSFTQAGTDTARKYGGTGLGLTISKQLTELMGGDISVTSKLNEGTVFAIQLPLRANESEDEDDEQGMLAHEAKQKLKGIHLLLVEDNEFNRMVAEDTLNELIDEVKIDIATNGKEAVERVQNYQYDLVLMDIQMPIMDGIQATKEIRKLPTEKKHTRIIAMTANVLQEDVKHYFDIGMNAYVAKPFHTVELLQKMAQTIDGKHNLTKALNEPAPQKNRFKKDLPAQVTDMQFLKQLTGGDPAKMQKYVSMFLENGPKLMNNIRESLKTENYPALKIAAHSLKPQLSYMGVKEEISNVFMLEQAAGEQGHFEKIPELVEHLESVTQQAFHELKALSFS